MTDHEQGRRAATSRSVTATIFFSSSLGGGEGVVCSTCNMGGKRRITYFKRKIQPSGLCVFCFVFYLCLSLSYASLTGLLERREHPRVPGERPRGLLVAIEGGSLAQG